MGEIVNMYDLGMTTGTRLADRRKLRQRDTTCALCAGQSAGEAAAAADQSGVGTTDEGDPRVVKRERPYTGMRRIIGDHVSASLQKAASVTYHGTADVDQLKKLLAPGGEHVRGSESTVVLDLMITATVVKAAAVALERMPRFNASLDGEVIKMWKRINVGVAVALSKGLIVPVVRDANGKGVDQIGSELRDLADRARENKLMPDEISGGTFTVTTLGPYRSVDFFTPIINLPEAAILGIGRLKDSVVVVDGKLAVRATMGLSLTSDHRMLDGAPSAEFLELVMDLLADPRSLLGHED